MRKRRHYIKRDTSWIWMVGLLAVFFISLIVCYGKACLKINGTASDTEAQLQEIELIQYSPPTLKSLIVHPDSSDNYFDFFLDTQEEEIEDEQVLEPLAKELIDYFFLGITLPSDDLWVNLNSVQEGQVSSPRLALTDIGKVLLEADLTLKKDCSRFTDPKTKTGKEYWDNLQRRLNEENLNTTQLPIGNRFWIIPEEAAVEEDIENNTVTIVKSRLKVCLEQEYLRLTPGNRIIAATNPQTPKQLLTQQICDFTMKETILPHIQQRVNQAEEYAKLRQVYNSLILAEYYKQTYHNGEGLYPKLINRAHIQGLESTEPWNTQDFYDAYVKSAQEGEYRFSQQEYDPFLASMVKKYYFYGGVFWEELRFILDIITKGYDRAVLKRAQLATISDSCILTQLWREPDDSPWQNEIDFHAFSEEGEGGSGELQDDQSDRLPSSRIEQVILNGEPASAENVKNEMKLCRRGSDDGTVSFSVKIEGNTFVIGMRPRRIGKLVFDHRLIEKPKMFLLGVQLGIYSKEGLSLWTMLWEKKLTPAEKRELERECYVNCVKLARFFGENVIVPNAASLPIKWEHEYIWNRGNEKLPHTVGEVASLPIIKQEHVEYIIKVEGKYSDAWTEHIELVTQWAQENDVTDPHDILRRYRNKYFGQAGFAGQSDDRLARVPEFTEAAVRVKRDYSANTVGVRTALDLNKVIKSTVQDKLEQEYDYVSFELAEELKNNKDLWALVDALFVEIGAGEVVRGILANAAYYKKFENYDLNIIVRTFVTQDGKPAISVSDTGPGVNFRLLEENNREKIGAKKIQAQGSLLQHYLLEELLVSGLTTFNKPGSFKIAGREEDYGHGNALANLDGLMKFSGGVISITTEPNVGTEVVLIFEPAGGGSVGTAESKPLNKHQGLGPADVSGVDFRKIEINKEE